MSEFREIKDAAYAKLEIYLAKINKMIDNIIMSKPICFFSKMGEEYERLRGDSCWVVGSMRSITYATEIEEIERVMNNYVLKLIIERNEL